MLRQTLPKAQVRRVAGLRDRSRARTCLGNPFGSPDPRMVESGPERRLYATRWSTFEQRPATDGQALDRQLGRIIPDVFVHTEKGPLRGQRQQEFNKAWRSACRKAGYTGTLLHDQRRSGVRAMVRAGVPESVAQRDLGTRDVGGGPALWHHQRSRAPRFSGPQGPIWGPSSCPPPSAGSARSGQVKTEAARNPAGPPDFKSGVRL